MSGPRPRHERIHELLHDGDHRRLRRVLTRFDEVQIAAQLDNLGPDDQRVIMGLLPVDRRAPVLGNMRYEAAAILVARLAPGQEASARTRRGDGRGVCEAHPHAARADQRVHPPFHH